jgi:DNA polymerase-4
MQSPLSSSTTWSRAILLVDMNAFFASIEQRDFPELRDRPVAVTNGRQGTCIITASYEARACGIHTGMRLPEARQLCPGLIQRLSRPQVYAETSALIMQSLQDITPDIEVFSVDEAFLDVTRCQRLDTPENFARRAQEIIITETGLPCSIGVSGDKTTAKFAAKLHKPNGITVIPPWETEARLHDVPVTELCGIGNGIGRYLADRGVMKCGDMKHLPMQEMTRRFGPLGQRIWLMCQGCDPSPVKPTTGLPKSIGHGKILPPATRSSHIISNVASHLCERVAARLRRHHMTAQLFFFSFRTDDGWIAAKVKLPRLDDGNAVFREWQRFIREHWQGDGMHQLQVTAMDPQPVSPQGDLFADGNVASVSRRNELNHAIDTINDRFGNRALVRGPQTEDLELVNVISPSWQPVGPRRTV